MTELEGIHVRVSRDRTLTMQDLVDGWQRHVTRLMEEMRVLVGEETWGAHDYFAALSLRDHIESGRSGLSNEEDALIHASVAGSDELLRSITEEDLDGLLIRYGEPEVSLSTRWWWNRVPTEGLVREELERWSASE